MARGRRSRRLMNQINVVPYIDVTLVLLIIFMITAPMTNPGVVELPQIGQAALKQVPSPLVLTLKPSGALELDGKSMERGEMLLEVRQKTEGKPEQSVVIAADKGVQYEDVVGIMHLLKQNNVGKVGLLLKPAP
ncbi:MAG TPA: biopolymer transporter ExbD [Methylophilaceae bacterium]|nr:biopolymer transporter ExbD [Methylophilaceae bacterium]